MRTYKIFTLIFCTFFTMTVAATDESTKGYENWEKLWKERIEALEQILGAHKDVYPATLPLYLGGTSDIISFPEHLDGIVYTTGSMTGSGDQKKNKMGEYELMICIKEKAAWAPKLLSKLSKYTLKGPFEPGAITDVRKSIPGSSLITSFLFLPYAGFELKGENCGLLLCIGITDKELEYLKKNKISDLVKILKEKGIYPLTDLDRKSAVD